MKSAWLSSTILCCGYLCCGILCCSILAGCSSGTSTAESSGNASVQAPAADPEWAKSDLAAPETAVVLKVQPIPDDDDTTGTVKTPGVKPIPEDGN